MAKTCKICTQLDEAVAQARRPTPPNILEGLGEAGLRNHARQREERELKAEVNLQKHQRACPDRDDVPAF